jgi:adenosylcobinamide kinase/adenosylcobinamide-phosphate guanylyltransferase
VSGLVGDEPPDIDALLDGPVADALAAVAGHRGPVVVVSDEIGLGLVPLDPLSRAFRDLQGIVHQRIAAVADEVHFMVAGLPLTVRDR